MGENVVLAKALFDYVRTHNDELTFKKGDTISVTQQLDGGWWQGSLNGVVGWFPSNYVVTMPDELARTNTQPSPAGYDHQILAHLHNFQDEILQHILEGEIRQVNELAQLVSSFITYLEPLGHLPFLNKIFHMKALLNLAINMHQAIASALMDMKQRPDEPKRVGKLFLNFASTVNAIGCDYSKVRLYIVTGLDKNVDLIERHLTSRGIKFQLARCKQQLCLVFDRLGRYPLLLKEIERYLEHPHVDREDILQAMNVYGEITERCAILRKFKEYDIDILLSTINSWQGVSIDKLGDPILTLRVVVTDVEQDPTDPSPIVLHKTTVDGGVRGGQLSVVMIFPTCVLLLARTQHSNVYEFTTKLSLNTLTVVGCFGTDTDLDLIVSAFSSDRESVRPCRIALSCTDQNVRDLLLSTLTGLIHYQTQIGPPAVTRSSAQVLSETVVDADVRGVQFDEPSAAESSPVSKQSQSTSLATRPPAVSSDPHLSGDTQVLGSVSTTSSEAATAARETTPPSLNAKLNTTTTSPSLAHRNSPSFSSGVHMLPHQITHHAHVQWLTPPDQCQKENEKPLPPRVLRSLHLDGPLDMKQQSWSNRVFSYINLGGGPAGSFTSSSGNKSAVPDGSTEAPTRSRPFSPKTDGVKELRRKKSDRQKSAINVDEVLRSVDKLHDTERQTADAALILQVVEAYCASAWTELGCRSVEAGQLNKKDANSRLISTVVSPTESKTLIQQFSSPALSLQSGSEPQRHSTAIIPTEFASTGRGDQDASVLVNRGGLAKRSGSKNKADLLQAPIRSGDQSVSSLHSTYSNAPADSVVLSMSPPPVILPTRSGRRL
ncbi:hypothetical protein CRM22_003100 [Opisthorchis felineus]|uniref:SH3 domain-containing protein n=1 Tax=Opisthorchis felineus TaxID=147828 RepID=A0A4S2M2W1_OPIFE|nr:hypothetical protein CRM22_003100 [Opisthorchis felineus]